MTEYEKVKDYFINIDFDMVDSDIILKNVYKEIKGYEQKLINDLDSVYNFEILVQKSSMHQLYRLCKRVSLKDLFIKKTGSKFIEVLVETISSIDLQNSTDTKYIGEFRHGKNEQNEESFKYKTKLVGLLSGAINENFLMIMQNKNGTHVLRKYFELVDYTLLQEYKPLMIKIVDSEVEIDVLITVIKYLQKVKSKRLIRQIIRKYFTIDNCKNRVYTHIFEDIVNLADSKTLSMIFDMIKNTLLDLIEDSYAVFVVMALIKKYPQENEYYFNMCYKDMKNNNVLLRVLENYVIQGNWDKVDQIIHKMYDISNVFEGFLLSHTVTPDTKYIPLIEMLMSKDKYRVNKHFVDKFDPIWARRKYGINLLKAFFEGAASNKLKKKMAKSIKGVSARHNDGKRIMELIRHYKNARLT